MSGAPGIELRGVRFAYPGGGFRLVADDLRVERGERVACVGPSGSGKTTLVDLIAGIRAPEAGSVRVGDVLVSHLRERERRAWRRARVGMVFQGFELLEYLSALDNVLLPFHLGAGTAPAGAARARALRLLEETGLREAQGRLPGKLSQGERQRVAVCRALVTEPELLLCDEGTASLDPEAAESTLDLILGQAQRLRATVFFVTHDHTILGRFERVLDARALSGGGA